MAKKVALAAFGILFLAACSPYSYNQEIASFSNSVDTIALAHQAGKQSIATQIATDQQESWVANRQRLNLLPGCDAVDPRGIPPKLPDCSIVTFGTTAAQPMSVQVRLANDDPVFVALKAYTQALAAVTNATDADQLAQATQGLTAATSGLANTVAKVAPSMTAESSLVAPVGALLGQGILFYLDSRRHAALRDAVLAVDPSIRVLGQTIEADLYVIRAHQIEYLQRDLHGSLAPFRDSPGSLSEADYRAKYTALQAKIDVIKQARAVDPKATAAAMVNAHHLLATALKDDTGQTSSTLTELTNFATAAGQVKAAIDTVANAGASAKK